MHRWWILCIQLVTTKFRWLQFKFKVQFLFGKGGSNTDLST